MPEGELVPGCLHQVAPFVRRLIAPNPGIMTGPGTNTYIVGDDVLAVIDPGPADPAHLEAMVSAVDGRLAYVLATHTHADHSPGAAALAERTGATTIGFVARDGFEPDLTWGDGDGLDLGPLRLSGVHTPGHASNHLCYLAVFSAGGNLLFSGDHIMGRSTVVIPPPDGDMAQYLDSLERLLAFDPPIDVIGPGHGPLLTDPRAVIEGYLAHRREREAAIVAALEERRDAGVDELVGDVYTDVDPERHPIARRSAWAHLRKLAAEGTVVGDDPDDVDTVWHATSAH